MNGTVPEPGDTGKRGVVLAGLAAAWPICLVIAPPLFAHSAPRSFTLGKVELLAALPTLLCALKTRSLAGTVVTGMLCYWGFKHLL